MRGGPFFGITRNLIYKTPPPAPSTVLSTLTALMNLITSSHLRRVSQAEQRRGREKQFPWNSYPFKPDELITF